MDITLLAVAQNQMLDSAENLASKSETITMLNWHQGRCDAIHATAANDDIRARSIALSVSITLRLRDLIEY